MPTVADTKPVVWVGMGLFFGLLLGIVITVAVKTEDTSESYEDYRRRMMGGAQPQMPPGHPPQGGGGGGQPPPQDGGHGGGDRAQASFAKVHFMKKFVKALRERPDNMFPSTGYETLLKEGAEPIVCADCHDPRSLNLEAMIQNDPGHEAVEPYRKNRRGFMIPLMEAWVKRLNERHGARLAKPVTCTDCHAWDPRSGEGNAVLPPLMVRFVKALKEKPQNRNPASSWKPLLKDPAAPSMLCGVCHGQVGEAMEKNLHAFDLTRPAKYADDKRFMVNLMERWVEKLNHEAGHLLTKAVVCLDCHETDPRR